MPHNSEKWSRKRKIDRTDEWRPLYMHPRPTSRAAPLSVLEACGSVMSKNTGSGDVRHDSDLFFDAVGRSEEGEGSVGAESDKLDEGAVDMSQCSSTAALLTDPAYLPYHKLVKLFKSFRLQGLQQDHRPLKIVRASRQYMYDNTNAEYLDCINSVSHVGHCHPAVSRAAFVTNNLDTVTPGWDIDWGEPMYPRHLRQTLPDHLDTFLFCNSGSEAVDLSFQLSRLYTGGTEALVVDNAFHGCTDSVYQLSPKLFKANNISIADWVRVLPMPDLYRGEHRREDPAALEKYLSASRDIVYGVRNSGRKVACFLGEPMLIVPGCIMPPPEWLKEIYKMVRECGGLCIADEVQTSLGRIGSHFWSFQAQEVIPDILIIGKTVGNGYPMASVITTKEIAAVLGERIREYRCTQVMDSLGCMVLEVLNQENLIHSAATVGSFLQEELIKLQHKYEYIGDIRGRGLVQCIEVVWSKQSRKPSQEIAEQIVQRMREEHVIMANEGNERNILMMMPPMCFSQENATSFVQRLDKVLTELPKHRVIKMEDPSLLTCSISLLPGMCEGRLGIIQPQEENEDEDEGSLNPRTTMDVEYAQHSYQDLD